MNIVRIGPVTAMPDLANNYTRPDKVTFFEIRLGGDAAGQVDLLYSQVEHYTFLPAETVLPNGTILTTAEDIKTIANDLLVGSKPANWGTPTNHGPKRSRLSISNNDARYVVFILQGNCQFAEGEVPFKVASDKDDYCKEARCIWMDNQNQPQITKRPPPGIEAKIGYFIALSNEDDSGVPAAFNIYLDLKFPDGSVIPITVDPDVGYPGGHS